ncbi:MAG: hypothetical protein AAF628_24860 [Planctomycetota bacterium]
MATLMTWLAATTVLGTGIAQEPSVTWRGEDHSIAELREEAADAAMVADRWATFVSETGYRLVLSDERRVLLVLSPTYAPKPKKEHREVGVMLDLVHRTREAFDRFSGPVEKKGPPAVILCVKTDDFPVLLEHLGQMDSRASDWVRAMGDRVAGFVMSQPLVGAWIQDPAGVDEWNPHNELVHRVAQVLTRKEAPNLPEWLQVGLAWHVEDAVQRSIYCFPHRAGFVTSGSHTDWGLWLANHFKPSRRKSQKMPPALQIEEFAHWAPRREAEFDCDKAYLAFGVARYLATQHPTKMPDLWWRMTSAIEKNSKIWITDHEWRTDPEYQLPLEEQLQMLEAVEPGLLEKATKYFRKRRANRVSMK